MLPLVGGVRPAIRWRTVLFPDPLGPMIAQKAPAGQLEREIVDGADLRLAATEDLGDVPELDHDGRAGESLRCSFSVTSSSQASSARIAQLRSVDQEFGDEACRPVRAASCGAALRAVQLPHVGVALMIDDAQDLGQALRRRRTGSLTASSWRSGRGASVGGDRMNRRGLAAPWR